MKTKHFIRNVLDGLSGLSDNQGLRVIENCGNECFKLTGMMENIKQKLAEGARIKTKSDVVNFIKTHVFPTFPCELKGQEIEFTYNIPKCICPVVKENSIESAYICHCTKGFAKSLFETIVGDKVEVQLVDSFLLNGKPCKMLIKY